MSNIQQGMPDDEGETARPRGIHHDCSLENWTLGIGHRTIVFLRMLRRAKRITEGNAMKKKPLLDPDDLRAEAENRLRVQEKPRPFLTEGDARRLLHELEVHQIELEMQNEELREARAEIEAGLDRYADLYDFAPVGYFTLSPEGKILQLNLAGARLLGTERARLMDARFGSFVSEGEPSTFEAFLAKALASRGGWEACEVAFAKEGYPLLFAQIEGSASSDRQECRIAVMNITDRKRADEAGKESKMLLDSSALRRSPWR